MNPEFKARVNERTLTLWCKGEFPTREIARQRAIEQLTREDNSKALANIYKIPACDTDEWLKKRENPITYGSSVSPP